MTKNYFSIIALFLFGFTAFSQNPVINISQSSPICSPGACTDLTATYTDVKEATSYTVSGVPYQPLYPFTGGTVIEVMTDDKWSPLTNIPFSFCFYGNTYNQFLIGPNGVITFDTTNQQAGGDSPWDLNDLSIPAGNFPIKNAIYGVYQDTNLDPQQITDSNVQNINYYSGGVIPNRYFVINFNKLPLFGPPNSTGGLQTSQIVFYEGTNVIDVNVERREPSNTWSNGNGVIGIQNQEGTLATVPTGRNTGNWSATNESWRFLPSGNSVTAFTWQKNGAFYSAENTITVCPMENETYTASITYSNCAGGVAILNSDILLSISDMGILQPTDITICGATASTFDLTPTGDYMLGGVNPNNYELLYYTNYQDALNYTSNYINNPTTYTGINGEVIYVRVTDLVGASGCSTIKNFALIIAAPLVAPSGDTEQTYTAGETLAAIELSGSAVNWYAAAEGGEPLPITTVLENGVTYYAELTETTNVCDEAGRSSAIGRFAVTVYDAALGNPEWTNFNFTAVPNPAKDILNLNSAETITSVAIYNLLGQEVMNKTINATTSQINVSGLSNGTYLMKVKGNNFVKTIKVIKE